MSAPKRICAADGCNNEVVGRSHKMVCDSWRCKKAWQRERKAIDEADEIRADAQRRLRRHVAWLTLAISVAEDRVADGLLDDVAGAKVVRYLRGLLPDRFLQRCGVHGLYDGTDTDGCPDCFGSIDLEMRTNGDAVRYRRHRGRAAVVPSAVGARPNAREYHAGLIGSAKEPAGRWDRPIGQGWGPYKPSVTRQELDVILADHVETLASREARAIQLRLRADRERRNRNRDLDRHDQDGGGEVDDHRRDLQAAILLLPTSWRPEDVLHDEILEAVAA